MDIYPKKLINQGFTDGLWVKGNLDLLTRPSIAVIGSRRTKDTPALDKLIKQRAQQLAQTAVKNNLVDVSGLAYGCDLAGQFAFWNNDGQCISVVASGIDKVRYDDRMLLQNDSLIISQFAPGTPANKSTFVIRDDLQALLADSVVALMFGNDPQRNNRPSGTWHAVNKALTLHKRIGVLDPQTLINTGCNTQLIVGNQQLIDKHLAIVDRIPR